MTKQNESFAQLLKMEIMERYGLREDQVRLSLQVHTTDLDLGRQVLADFDKYEDKNLLPETSNCDYVQGTHLDVVYVHRKDGFYGQYINEKEGENNE